MERGEIRGRRMDRNIVPGFRFAQPGLRATLAGAHFFFFAVPTQSTGPALNDAGLMTGPCWQKLIQCGRSVPVTVPKVPGAGFGSAADMLYILLWAARSARQPNSTPLTTQPETLIG